MAHDLQDDLEFVAAGHDYDDFEFDDAGGNGLRTSGGASQYQLNTEMNDTSALEYRQGKDMQEIPWERLNYSRDQYRQMRLKQYKNYQSLARPRDALAKECQRAETRDAFYDFHLNTRHVKPTIVHFQLRNLLWATSKHDVYVTQNYSVMHWSSLLRRGKEVLNVAGPNQDMRGGGPLSRVQISTMMVKDNLLAAGGFHGELICKYVDQPGVAFCTNLAGNKKSITNAVEIYKSPNGSTRVMAANNDCVVRTFDTEKYSLLTQFPFAWSVNNMSVSPDGKLLAVLGDSSDCLIADSGSGKVNREDVLRFGSNFCTMAAHRGGVGSGNREPARARGLLVRVGVAPGRARAGHGQPGQDVPAVGRAQPVRGVRGAGGEDRRRQGAQVLAGRPLPGRGRAGGLRPRLRRGGRVRPRAGDRSVRRDRRRVLQPRRRRGGAVRGRRRPYVRQPARVP
uniref:Uncharacterized protein n=2 Tax=Triticum urartu TaxID=4572 RepID=A0A8R7U8A6_TRIUA